MGQFDHGFRALQSELLQLQQSCLELEKQLGAATKESDASAQALDDVGRRLKQQLQAHAETAARVRDMRARVAAQAAAQAADAVKEKQSRGAQLLASREQQSRLRGEIEARAAALSERLPRERAENEAEQRRLRGTIAKLQASAKEAADSARQHEKQMKAAMDELEEQLKHDRAAVRQLRDAHAQAQQKQFERRADAEKKLQNIVSSHPNSAENVWRRRVESKRAEVQRFTSEHQR